MTRDDGPPTRTGTDSSDRDGTDRFRALPFLRRDFLSDSAKLGAGALALSATGGAAAQADGQTDDGQTEGGQVDQPEGASIEVLAPHAGFTDDVGMALGVSFEQDGDEAAFLPDASTILLARVTLEPGGTTGWHTHPGPVVVTLVEGELDVVFAHTCTTHTYAAGEAFVDPGGHEEVARNPSDTQQAVAYALFLGVPDGESPTTHVEPQDC
ncbi:cupin domain-containing protein [Halomicroarcula sp. F13]|uniref:Cupin domain-containing protein n=1 Tax=Haloarcula rubra TaxID=2487747 RepID=A0AAW4PN78_9EURY|nr:cupin domain-containing protein [Halomicroarcula rubra]MBX0322581.1 cupin domain-containing protein [Halomicroarcula rubra]